MTPEEIEQLRRSIVMLPEGHAAGALTKTSALLLIHEVVEATRETARYRQAVEQLRQVLEALDEPLELGR